jgi:hypothetical protein
MEVEEDDEELLIYRHSTIDYHFGYDSMHLMDHFNCYIDLHCYFEDEGYNHFFGYLSIVDGIVNDLDNYCVGFHYSECLY